MNKGLTDEQLIAKYEAGKMPIKKVIAKMLRTKSPNVAKNSKRKS